MSLSRFIDNPEVNDKLKRLRPGGSRKIGARPGRGPEAIDTQWLAPRLITCSALNCSVELHPPLPCPLADNNNFQELRIP